MDKQLQALQHNLEAAVQRADADGIEFWFARDLQAPLGYARWENFQTAIQHAMESCETSGHAVSDHFRGITKLIVHGKDGESVVNQWLTTAADGNLSVIPTGSQNPKQWRTCHG